MEFVVVPGWVVVQVVGQVGSVFQLLFAVDVAVGEVGVVLVMQTVIVRSLDCVLS